ncbi:MAG: DAK2 domain-containing protein [Anaerolineae bacterium]|nr:DAK2 domain-containing protein [Anaerolineae bacterium]
MMNPLATNGCDGQALKQLAVAGRIWLEQHHERVNQLNVFPIPDGDTGINMLLTMRNACAEVEDDASPSAAHIARKLAHGAIMGSRGNSGTILSRIWSGFAQGLGTAEQLSLPILVLALRHASDSAYSGVQTPTEGTILTIIRELAEAAARLDPAPEHDAVAFLERLVAHGWQAVERTPEQLPILKQPAWWIPAALA